MQQRMFEYLKLKLEGAASLDEGSFLYGNPDVADNKGCMAIAISLSLENVGLPLRYQEAVSAKQSAEEDIQLAKNQRQESMTQARTKLNSAQTAVRPARRSLQTTPSEGL